MEKVTKLKTQKHVPMRTCIVTHKKFPKSELIRLVKTETGEIKVDLKGKVKGRGANILPDLEVFDRAIKNGTIERALKIEKRFSPRQENELKMNFQSAIEERSFRPDNKPVSIRIAKKDLEKIGSRVKC